MRAIAMVLVTASCATNPPAPARSALSAAEVQVRLADADALAARGCYLCLREAATAYDSLLQMAPTPTVLRHALENDLMIAIREIDLRLPDSGANERARGMADAADYDLYFGMLERPAGIGPGMTLATMRQRDADQNALAEKLEAAWPSSAMAAYFYIPTAAIVGRGDVFKEQAAAILSAYPHNLAVRYRLHTDPAIYNDTDVLGMLEEEPRFAELHFLRGRRAVAGTDLVTAHHEYSAAHDTLPESLAIAVSLGSLELAFGRHAQALALFDGVLAREPDHEAQLGRAMALSSLKRHREAIAYLDELITDPSWRPGDKYYWRAWNYLQLGESQHAYDDANAALKTMVNSPLYQLAGIASYNLTRVPDARTDFEESVKMNAANCDSIRYVGIIDAAERKWPVAVARFNAAAGCYAGAIAALERELAEKQADTSGLYAGQIPGLLAEIAEAKSLLEASTHNAEVAAKNAR